MEFSFVGRQVPLAQLADNLAAASNGRGSLTVIAGEPGIGKSRLVREFVAGDSTATVLTASAHEWSESTFGVWRTIVSSAQRRSRDQSSAGGGSLDSLLGLTEDIDSMATLADSIVEVLTRLPAPVVVVIEDLHWLDQGSRRLLNLLALRVVAEPIAIITTLRSEFAGSTEMSMPGAAQVISLAGLGATDIEQALTNRFPGSAQELQRASDRLVELTGGNPLACYGTVVALERGVSAEEVVAELASLKSDDLAAPEVLARAVDTLLDSLNDREALTVAAGVIADDYRADVISELTGMPMPEVDSALAVALRSSVLVQLPVGVAVRHPLLASGVLGRLSSEDLMRLHAARAEMLAEPGRDDWSTAVAHALRAGTVIPRERVSELADLAGRQAAHELAYEDADRFLAIADEYDTPSQTARTRSLMRLLLRAKANVALGQMDQAYELFSQAASLAEALGDLDALTQAAIGFGFPPDWRAGNPAALELLDRADRALRAAGASELNPAAIRLDALHAMLEMRIPKQSPDGRQWGWLLRTEAAQQRAELALGRAEACEDRDARMMALLGWRWTHRGPKHLERRLATSAQAMSLAFEMRAMPELMEACVRRMVDAIEAGDRRVVDDVLTTAAWANERSNDLRLEWRLHALQAGLATLEGRWDDLDVAREQARLVGEAAQIPGAFVLDHSLRCAHGFGVGDLSYFRQTEELAAALPPHPLVSAVSALAYALDGDLAPARKASRDSLQLLDQETSYLACLGLIGQTAALLSDGELARECLPLLRPWQSRWAVDAEALFIPGPLGWVVADLAEMLGEDGSAARLAGDRLHSTLIEGEPAPVAGALVELSSREHAVLREIVRGRTNTEIAQDLRYSLATIRRDTTAIYQKLGVSGRAEAAARAAELGIVFR